MIFLKSMKSYFLSYKNCILKLSFFMSSSLEVSHTLLVLKENTYFYTMYVSVHIDLVFNEGTDYYFFLLLSRDSLKTNPMF